MGSAKTKLICARFASRQPQPFTELQYTNAYTLLVAVVLSAQATDIGVNKATTKLFTIADTPEKMLALGEERLKEYIRTIGLYRTKAKHIIALSQVLLQEHDGQIPSGRESLEKLPGVGRKTANIILNIVFGQPTIGVDTHVLRVSNRLGLVHTKKPLAAELQLLKNVPPEYLPNLHNWLVLHGRYVCKALKPLCAQCFLSDICEYSHKNLPVEEKNYFQ